MQILMASNHIPHLFVYFTSKISVNVINWLAVHTRNRCRSIAAALSSLAHFSVPLNYMKTFRKYSNQIWQDEKTQITWLLVKKTLTDIFTYFLINLIVGVKIIICLLFDPTITRNTLIMQISALLEKQNSTKTEKCYVLWSIIHTVINKLLPGV